jgi:hypothetical protein
MWHQIATFQKVGLHGGYYTIYEIPARLNFIHFSSWGPFYPALYGLLAVFVGWETYTGILLNMAGIAGAIWIFIWVTKPDRLQIVLLSLLLLSIAPVLLFIPTIMQESFHQAAALILAAIFYRLLQQDKPLPRWFLLTGAGFLFLISLIRLSWSLLFLPFFILSQKKWTWPRLLGACFATGIVAVVILVIFQNTGAAGGNSIFSHITALSSSPLAGLQAMGNTIQYNLGIMLRVPDLHQMDSGTVGFVQFFVLLFVFILGGNNFLGQDARPGTVFVPSRELLFHLYNLISVFAAALGFYLVNGYLRVLAPHILLTGLLLIAFRHFRLVVIVMVIGLFGIGMFLKDYSLWDSNFIPYSPQRIEQLKAPYQQFLIYDEHADPWCNTVLIQVRFLDNHVTLVPPGIGISFFTAPADQPLPIKSQYLLLDPLSYEVLHTRVNLEFLANIQGGKLYRNLDANCAAR